MAGTGLYWAHGEHALRALAEELRIPVFVNGLGRGCMPGRPRAVLLARARAGPQGGRRRAGGRRADGLPPRLRRLVRRRHADRDRRLRAARPPPAARAGARAVRRHPGHARRAARRAAGGPDRSAWIAALREIENEKRAGEQDELTDDRAPLHPLRLYDELRQVLDRDAIVIGDGGDFVSYAGPRDRHLRARLLDGPGAVRLPRRRARATRWRPSSPTRTSRSACCWATAPSASRAWSSTRSCATACRSSA